MYDKLKTNERIKKNVTCRETNQANTGIKEIYR
jgi:hypothetical protein